MSIQKAHELVGHSIEDVTRKTAKALGWTITRGSLRVCGACSEAKAKQKNLHSKNPDESEKASKVNEHVHLDLATIKAQKPCKSRSVCRCGISSWMRKLDLRPWKDVEMLVINLRMDNAGENKKLEKEANGRDWQLGINCEYTA
eukprot:scaffold3199_cov165-Amphora_coffeaeformis.AAC.18